MVGVGVGVDVGSRKEKERRKLGRWLWSEEEIDTDRRLYLRLFPGIKADGIKLTHSRQAQKYEAAER